MRKNIITLLLALIAWAILIHNASATGQEGERLTWNGKSYQMLTCPLYANPDMKKWHEQREREWGKTSLWRGYIGHWEIENGMLYLCSIWREKGGDISPNEIPELRKYCKNGKCAATWFSDTLCVVSGKQVFYEHMGFNRHYEHEDFIIVKRGKVMSVKRIDNKSIIKGKIDEPDANKKLTQFLDDLGAQLHKRYPEESGRIIARVQYSNFDLMMMPTDVDVTFLKHAAPTNPQIEKEIKEKLANYILTNQFLPLYYINGEIKKVAWALPIRITK